MRCGHGCAHALCCRSIRIFGQLDDRHVLGQDLGDDRAAVEDDQPVGDLVDMGEVVLDIDAGAAGCLDAAHEVEDLAHLGDGQRRRRLVEHDEVGVVVHGPADGDALALAAREVGDGGIDGDADAAEADGLLQDLRRRSPSPA